MQINVPNLADAYWRADNGRIYSSSQQKIVTKDDAGLASWVEAGNTPIVWPRDDDGSQTNAALNDVLVSYGMAMAGFTAIPASVTSAQAKIQCLRTPGSAKDKTLLDDIRDAVQVAGGEVEIWFSEARTWERTNPYVANLSSGLKLTSAQVDDLFVAAAKIAA